MRKDHSFGDQRMETAADVDVPNYVEGDWCEVLRCNGRKPTEGDFLALAEQGQYSVPQLIRLLESTDHKVVGSAAETLGKIGPQAKSAEPHLIKLIEHEQANIRWGATYALGRIVPDPAAVSLLVNRLQDKAEKHCIRCDAAGAIGAVGAGAEHAVPDLISCLSDEMRASPLRHELVREITHALGKIGPKATAACESLSVLLEHSNPKVQKAAIVALGSIGSANPAAILTMAKLLYDPSQHIRYASAMALRQLGSEARTVAGELVLALSREDSARVLEEIARAISHLGPEAKAAVPRLIELVRNEDGKIRRYAIRSLGRIGAHADLAVPTLELQLSRENRREVRRELMEALIGIRNTSGIKSIVQVFKSRFDSLDSTEAAQFDEDFGLYFCTDILQDVDPHVLRSHFCRLSNLSSYLLFYKLPQIKSHVGLLSQLNDSNLCRIGLEQVQDPDRGAWELVVASVDMRGALSRISGCLASLGFSIDHSETFTHENRFNNKNCSPVSSIISFGIYNTGLTGSAEDLADKLNEELSRRLYLLRQESRIVPLFTRIDENHTNDNINQDMESDSENIINRKPDGEPTPHQTSTECDAGNIVADLSQLDEELERSRNTMARRIEETLLRYSGRSFGSFEANRDVASRIQSLLQKYGLRLMCPVTKMPANLRFRPAGRAKHGSFQLDVFDETGRRTNHVGPTTLPLIAVVPAPPRRKKLGD